MKKTFAPLLLLVALAIASPLLAQAQPVGVPALGPLGLAALAAGLVGGGALMLRRRRR